MPLQHFEGTVEKDPQHLALFFNNQNYSYGALGEAVARLRGALLARGITRGDRVAIMLPNSPHFIISYLAVTGIGAIAVPVHTQCKARELTFVTEDSEIRAVIAWANFAADIEKAAANSDYVTLRLYLGDNIPVGAENLVDLIASGERAPAVVAEPSDSAVILYTAGSSGYPRGAEFTHGSLSTHALELSRLLRIRDTDRILCTLPFSSACGLCLGVNLPLQCGARLDIHSRFHPGDTLRYLQDEQVTVLVANPAAYAGIASFPTAEKTDLSRLRYALSCDAKLSDQTAQDIYDKLKVRIFEGYGTTETCGIIALNMFPALLPHTSVGQPIGDHEIAVFGEDAQPVPPNKPGQIAVRGPAVMKGYRNRQDKTRQVIKDGWLLTGDRGYVDEQSNLFITGHATELILKGGFPIYAREVEEIVEGLPHVQEVAVVGIPDPVFGEEIKACVVLKEGAVIGPNEIIEYVKERAALYKCPKIVKLYKELPRTAGGKIIRGQLKEEKS